MVHILKKYVDLNENKRLYHIAMLCREAKVTMLNCALLRFPQQTQELLHLGYFHFWTLRHFLTLLALHTHTHTITEREVKRKQR